MAEAVSGGSGGARKCIEVKKVGGGGGERWERRARNWIEVKKVGGGGGGGGRGGAAGLRCRRRGRPVALNAPNEIRHHGRDPFTKMLPLWNQWLRPEGTRQHG